MSDAPQGPDWWQASDGRWYPPQAPVAPPPVPPAAPAPVPPAAPPPVPSQAPFDATQTYQADAFGTPPPFQAAQPFGTPPPYPGGPSAPPPGSGGGKGGLVVVAVVVVAVLAIVAGIVGLVLAGGDDDEESAAQELSDDADEDEAEDEGDEDASSTTEAEESTTTEAEESTTTTPPTTTTAAAPLGTRTNPVPLGQPVSVGDWDVMVVSFNPDATPVVMEYNQFNDPPEPGRVFAMAAVRVTYRGPESGSPWIDLTFKALDDSNVAVTDGDCGVIPGDAFQLSDVFTGGTVDFNVCFPVDPARVPSLVLIAEETFSFSDTDEYFAVY